MADELTSYRDDKGRFVEGNPGGPGRKTRAQELAVLDAVKAEFTPAAIAQGLRDAYDLAKKQGSTRGMVAVLTLALEYTVGKPNQKITVNNDATDFLAKLLEDRTPLLPPRQGAIDSWPRVLEDK